MRPASGRFMPVSVVLVVAAACLAVAAAWIWLWAGIAKSGARRIAGAVALQLSFVVLVVGVVNGHGLSATLDALTPPLFIFLFPYYAQFDTFLFQVLPWAGVAAAIVLVACLAVPRLRLWSVAPSLLAFFAVGVIVGERISQQAMCKAAEAADIPEFRRRSLLWSLYNTPEELQFDIHAVAETGGRRLGWSYREMGWYEIPPDAWGEVDAPPFDCDALVEPKV
jgi:hypothetical protein